MHMYSSYVLNKGGWPNQAYLHLQLFLLDILCPIIIALLASVPFVQVFL